MLKKEERVLGALLYTLRETMLISCDAKKMWSGTRTCAGANSIKNCFIVPVSSPRQLPLTTCLKPGKRKTKINAILFDVDSKHI